jgi:hypothetical protein
MNENQWLRLSEESTRRQVFRSQVMLDEKEDKDGIRYPPCSRENGSAEPLPHLTAARHMPESTTRQMTKGYEALC